jgi:hypothetical protein
MLAAVVLQLLPRVKQDHDNMQATSTTTGRPPPATAKNMYCAGFASTIMTSGVALAKLYLLQHQGSCKQLPGCDSNSTHAVH